MAYNTTDRDKQKAAAQDTAKKIKCEKVIAVALESAYFLPIARDFQRTYSQSGSILPLDQHHANLSIILNRNYRGTSKKFIGQVRDALGMPEDAIEINNQINAVSQAQQLIDINQSGGSIAQTTTKSLNNSVRDVIVASAAAGIVLTHRQIAKQARDKFMSDSKGRVPGISMTQTAMAAEGAKHTELHTLLRNNAVFPKSGVNLARDKVEKTWITILDSRTRAAHVEADMQKVPFDGVYTVMGQQLRYPTDTSLGATAENVINCRCSSVKSIVRVR